MSDLALVLEMGNDLGLARERPHEAASIGRRVFLGRPDPDVGLMDVGGGVVHQVDQQSHELVDYVLVLIFIRDLEGVVKEDVSCGRKKGRKGGGAVRGARPETQVSTRTVIVVLMIIIIILLLAL